MVMWLPTQLKIRSLNLFIKNKIALLGFLSAICYFILGYFTNRSEFVTLLLFVSILFSIYFYLLQKKTDVRPNHLFMLGLFFRMVLLGCSPFLSQDFYRFIWDGRLLASGFSPFEQTPNQLINSTTMQQAKLLFDGMGSLSASHFSNYPPVNQLLFAVAGLLSSKSIIGSIIVFRIQIIIADVGIYFIGKKLLRVLALNENAIFLYFLNPLVIIELTANLHFEGVMLCFFLLGIYFLLQKKLPLSALFISLAIATKLLPLLLLPILFQFIGWKKSIAFYLSIIVANGLLFLPFISNNLIHNYVDTLSLWFINFEFNASFYYLIRAIGYYIKGYNIIGTVGKIMPILLLLFIAITAFLKNNKSPSNLFLGFLLILSVYFFQATTVHPWYVINLIILTCFTKFRFPIVWSFTIFLSYFAYTTPLFKENLALLFLEYIVVFGFLLFEWQRIKITCNLNKHKKCLQNAQN